MKFISFYKFHLFIRIKKNVPNFISNHKKQFIKFSYFSPYFFLINPIFGQK